MQKFWILLAIVVVGIGLYLVARKTQSDLYVPIEAFNNGEKTDFLKAGTLEMNNPGQNPDVLYLIYEEPGAPALVKALAFNEVLSACLVATRTVPCLELEADATLNGKRAIVEGNVIAGTDAVDVFKLYVLAEGQPELVGEPGNVFVPWNQAVRLLEDCQIEMVLQTHAQDVYLTLKSGGEVKTVEPTIDAVFDVIQRTQAKCGSFPIATE